MFTVAIDPSSLPSRVHQQMNCVLVVTIVDDDGNIHIIHVPFTNCIKRILVICVIEVKSIN